MAASLIARRVAIRSHNVLLTRLSSTSIYALSFSNASSSVATATVKTNTNTKSKYNINPLKALAIATASLFSGYCIGTSHSDTLNTMNTNRELPSGETSGCCSCEEEVEDAPKSNIKLQLTEEQIILPTKLQKIVGQNHVIDGTKPSSTNSMYLKGARLGHGNALCIVQPGTLKEVVKCLQLIVDAGCVVLPQGSNTGLTGG